MAYGFQLHGNNNSGKLIIEDTHNEQFKGAEILGINGISISEMKGSDIDELLAGITERKTTVSFLVSNGTTVEFNPHSASDVDWRGAQPLEWTGVSSGLEVSEDGKTIISTDPVPRSTALKIAFPY